MADVSQPGRSSDGHENSGNGRSSTKHRQDDNEAWGRGTGRDPGDGEVRQRTRIGHHRPGGAAEVVDEDGPGDGSRGGVVRPPRVLSTVWSHDILDASFSGHA